MNWITLPPLSALRAFCAYCQAGTLEEAGAALNVTHAAISQQLRVLETHLGVSLLDRSARKLALTAEGEILARTLETAFGEISRTVDHLTGAEADRPLHVACTPSFAANWLMPRLARFRALHPETELMINPSPQRTDPTPGGIDIALRYGSGKWPGLDAEPLVEAPLVVIAAPDLFEGALPQRPEELLDLPWLQELGRSEATSWLESRGITGQKLKSLTHVPGNLMIDGVRSGQGVAVSTRIPVEEDLVSGRLIALFEDKDGAAYHIVTPPGIPRPSARNFITWIRREATTQNAHAAKS